MEGSHTSRRAFLRTGLALGGLAGVSPLLSACGDDDSSSNGVTSITMWHGQSDSSKATLDKLVSAFNSTHKNIKVNASSGGVLADAMLQKITTALAAEDYPDVAYIFGSDIASVARSPLVVDLTESLKAPAVKWDDFWPAAKAAVTVDGKLRGIPALVDNLCVAYNKKVFSDAGVEPPKAGWTWDDYVAIAKQLTNPGKGTFGTGWPGVGDENTVWRLWPMVWDAGGDVVNQDGKSVAFDGKPGLTALQTVYQLGQDKSVYVDTKPGGELTYQIFMNNKMGMIPTGPWELPEFLQSKTDYGVVPMPSYSGKPMTIAGPDTWTVFDNGEDRVKATVTFLTWLTSGNQDVQWAQQAGSLPLRTTTTKNPKWTQHIDQTNGLNVFTDALAYAKTRPTIEAYPKVSRALGQATSKMLLTKSTPDAALKEAVQQANSALEMSR